MEVFEIILVAIIGSIIIIGVIRYITNSIHNTYNYNKSLQALNAKHIIRVRGYIKLSPTPIIDEQIILRENNNYLLDSKLIDNMNFYEYKIENTYFPIVINNIIKDYIYYRLIVGYSPTMIYRLDYPYKMIIGNYLKRNIYNSLSNNLYKYNINGYNTYTLNIEDGFEISPKIHLLDIKVQ